MKAPEDVDYALYSLTDGNPYRQRDLDASRAEDEPFLLHFSNFPARRDINEHMARTIARGKTTAFLLSGREGTGRGTLAKSLIHWYVSQRGIGSSFELVEFTDINHDSKARLHQLLKEIRNSIIRLGHWEDRREELMREIPLGYDDRLTDQDLQYRAEYLARFTANETPAITFGLLIDKLQEDSFMDLLATAFKNVCTVIVVTRDDYTTPDTADADRLAQRERRQNWAMHLDVPPLNGGGVRELAENHWVNAAPQIECPFDLPGVEQAFDRREEPIGRALHWLNWLLRWKLEDYRGTEPWPLAKELGLTHEWIENVIRKAETAPQGSGAVKGPR